MYRDYNKSFKYNSRYNMFKLIPSWFNKYFLFYKYRKTYGKNLNLKRPLTLSEKLQWIKLNDDNIEKKFFSDKLNAKEYVKGNFPTLKCAKVYQTGSKFEDLDFSSLPEKFIIKTNHAWKTNTFILNKNDLSEKELELFKKAYNKVLKINYAYWSYYELQYKNIIPKIYAEEILIDGDKIQIIPNYEVYCFNGTPEFILYRNKQLKQGIYNTKWEKLDFSIEYKSKADKERPIFLEEMINYSKKLSEKFNFVRIDFFEANNEIYFGEMTFTPYSGFIKYTPDIYDLYYGQKLKLN